MFVYKQKRQHKLLKVGYFSKVQSCKLYNNKYRIVSTQITNTGIFAFIDNRNC